MKSLKILTLIFFSFATLNSWAQDMKLSKDKAEALKKIEERKQGIWRHCSANMVAGRAGLSGI